MHWTKIQTPRSYTLFERLAGVRGDVRKALVPPRGMPDDVTETTKMDYDNDGEDAHTPSWLTGQELQIIIEEVEQDADHPMPSVNRRNQLGFGYLFGNGFDVKKYPQDYPRYVVDCRAIFWFDN